MRSGRTIGILLILGAWGVLVPYLLLTDIFDYPDILREDPGVILTRFHQGGARLIWTWWAFGLLGLPLVVAYSMMYQKTGQRHGFMQWATVLGILGLVAQMIGLLRWPLVVPVLARNFVSGTETAKETSKILFEVVHQYGGVVLGEHLGQLLTILWTVMATRALSREKLLPGWVAWLGYGSSFIYAFAQADLVATVIPGFPVVAWSGFAGSTLWLVWLMVVGTLFIREADGSRSDRSFGK